MKKELKNSKDNSPVFIVGMARSGTTLLRSILNSHPTIAVPRETTFFYLLNEYLKTNKVSSFSNDEVDEFWNWYSKKRRFTYLGLEEQHVKDNFKSFKDTNKFKVVLDSVMLTNLKKNKKTRWGEKTPGHEEFLETIFEMYPNAKVLFMIRDPRSVYASLMNVPWNNQFVSVIIKRWNKSVKKYLEYKDDERVRLITYEELVTNTKENVIEVCKFIGEEFTEEMIVNRAKDISSNSNDGWTTKYEKEVVRTVDNSSVDKWKESLSNFEITLLENYSNKVIFSEFYKYSGIDFDIMTKLKFLFNKFLYYVKSFFKKSKED